MHQVRRSCCRAELDCTPNKDALLARLNLIDSMIIRLNTAISALRPPGCRDGMVDSVRVAVPITFRSG